MTNKFDEELKEFALITSAHGVRYVTINPTFRNLTCIVTTRMLPGAQHAFWWILHRDISPCLNSSLTVRSYIKDWINLWPDVASRLGYCAKGFRRFRNPANFDGKLEGKNDNQLSLSKHMRYWKWQRNKRFSFQKSIEITQKA